MVLRQRSRWKCKGIFPGSFFVRLEMWYLTESEEFNMDRIQNHPILEDLPERKMVSFTYNGKKLEGYEGEPIAAALRVNGVMAHRYTKKKHEPRGVFCAIGRCTDCVMVVNGKPNVRTCITPLEEGMEVQTQYGASAKEEA